jgi:hypothetical protein
VTFRLASRSAPSPERASSALRTRYFTDSAVVALGSDSIVMRRVELVLKDIQLAPTESGECDSEEEDEWCGALAMGPVVVALPLSDSAVAFVTAAVPAATYIGLHFALYAPDPSRDSAFVAGHPEFSGTSVRVQGTFSRAGKHDDFVYTTDFTEQHESGLLPPLVVTAKAAANFTVRLDVATWFLNAAKTALIAPASAGANQPNRPLVHDNIRTSVAAFRDDDRNGLDDVDQPRSAAVSVEPWPPLRESDSGRFAVQRASGSSVPRCRSQISRLTSDSIGPFRAGESLAELRRKCPQLLLGWEADPDGYPVPTAAARLGPVVVTVLLTDTLPAATVREVGVDQRGPTTAEGVGVGSLLRDLEQAYGAAGASEADCVLRVWFPSVPGLAFRMAFPAHARRECGELTEEPLPQDLRVAAVILVPG